MYKMIAATIIIGLSPAVAAEVVIELEGLAEAEGSVYVSAYDSPDTWLGDETVMTQEVEIDTARDGELVRFTLDLAPGEYALSIFYDANGNDELDTNWIGLPKEPVALSNNARPKFGPPKYKDAVFTLGEEPVVQRIQIEAI
ncbi:MAG: DUF2141 domain-containing protein [Pseudomonadota bacterium]